MDIEPRVARVESQFRWLIIICGALIAAMVGSLAVAWTRGSAAPATPPPTAAAVPAYEWEVVAIPPGHSASETRVLFSRVMLLNKRTGETWIGGGGDGEGPFWVKVNHQP